VTPFLYYSKVANVDIGYLMWFAMCLVFYLRVLDRGTAADYVWWAATGTLAVCSKDQAYGLIVGMPLVVVLEQARANVRVWSARHAVAAPHRRASARAHRVLLPHIHQRCPVHVRPISPGGLSHPRALRRLRARAFHRADGVIRLASRCGGRDVCLYRVVQRDG